MRDPLDAIYTLPMPNAPADAIGVRFLPNGEKQWMFAADTTELVVFDDVRTNELVAAARDWRAKCGHGVSRTDYNLAVQRLADAVDALEET
jgi:hypothetical protein